MRGSDVGLEAVEKIFQTLQVDEEWAVRRPRGFTWWAYGIAQHIDAGESWQDDEFQLSKIRIVTELVKSVNSKRQPEQMAAVANMQGILSSKVFDGACRVPHCEQNVYLENDQKEH